MEQSVGAPFGELVQAGRKQRYLSQQALADALGVHRNTIGTWERGDGLYCFLTSRFSRGKGELTDPLVR